MPYAQRIARHSLNVGGRQARRLLEMSVASGPALHLRSRLIFFASYEYVIPLTAQENFQVGDVTVSQGENYFLVQSCAPHWYYVVVHRGQDWQCSCQQEVRAKYISMVEQFLSEHVQGEVA